MPLHASHNKSNNDHSKKQQRRRRSGHRRRAKATHNKTTRLHNGHAAAAAAQSQSAVFLSSLSMMQEDDARTSAPTTVTHTRDSVDTDEADGSGNAHTADTTASQSSLSSSSGSSGSNCDDAAQHEALSFWVGALCQHSRSVASPMTPSSSSSSSSVTAAVDEDTTRSSSTTATAADDAAAATRSATMTLRRKRRRRADSDKDSETGRRLLSHAPPLRSALPLYTELLSGLLGPVAVDVQVLGGVSLLRSPAAFARVLQTHERATRADLARLLRSVTVYVLVRGVHVYVLDAVSCSATAAATTTHGSGNKDKEHDVAEAAAAHAVLPLLAELLRAPAVVTIVLHIRLLCQLLFLFLGSDRVSIGARVVDVAVCSECVAQQDRQYATSSSGRDDSKGDDSSSVMHTLDDVLRALPDDVRLSLQARREAVVRWARAQGRKRAQTPSTSTSAAAAKAHAQRRGGDGSNSGSDSRSSDDDSGDSDDNSSSSSDDSDTAASSMCVHVGDAATLGDTFVALAALFAYYSHHLATIVVVTTTSSSSSSGSSVVDCGGSVLWRQCVRRTSAHVSCARMTYHGVFVSKARYAAVCGDVHAQLVDLSRLAQMHMAGMSSSASALLLAHVHDARQQQQRQQQQRQQQPLLLQSMRARDIVDCLLYCLDDTTRSALVGGHGSGGVAVSATVNDGDAHTNTSATSMQQQQQQPLPRRPQDTHSAGYLAYCVHFIEQQQQLHDNVQSDGSSGCSSSDVHAALRVARVWLAAHEREAYVRSLRDLLTSDCRLVVRVLPAPASNRTDAHTLAATTTATAATSAPPVVCYSVHPRWQLHSHTTGRIFASCPNVQTLPRQPPVATYPPPPPHIASNTYTATTTVVVMPSHASGSSGSSRDAGSATHVKAGGNTAHVMLREHAAWTLRHLFVAAPGCALVSLDYNQMELRILAHLSRDATLCAQLRRRDGDALRAMACTVLSCASEAEVTAWQRQAVKTLVYGLLYGMGEASMDKCIVELMATSTTSTATTTAAATSDASSSSNGSSSKSSQDDAATTTAAAAATTTTTTLPALAAAAAAPAPPQPLSARALVRAFHRRYPGVQAYVRATRRVAVRDGVVRMLDGSVRRVTATTSACAAATTAAAAAAAAARHDSRRRWQQGVSWAVQGSAADVLHSAMHTIQAHEHDLLPCFTAAAPAALIAAMHDELVYTVPAAAMALVVPRLRALMEQQSSVFDMCVPLRVSVRVGPSLGELREWHEG